MSVKISDESAANLKKLTIYLSPALTSKYLECENYNNKFKTQNIWRLEFKAIPQFRPDD